MAKVRENIKKLSHYKPPLGGRASEGYLLLDFNERTTEPSLKVKEALRKFIDSGKLQAYPEYENLEEKIAEYAGVLSGEAIATNGADQGIDLVFRAYVDRGDKVIIPFPSFPMEYQLAALQGADILKPLYGKEDSSFPLQEILDLIDEEVKLIAIVNPNNPTGTPVLISDIEKILKKAKEKGAVLLHDEAYFEFSGLTCKDLIKEYDNFYIVRTFSKSFGFPSLRGGYALSQKENIQELLKIRGPYDVNMAAKVAILAALEDTRYMEDYAKEVMEVSKPKLEEFLKEKNVFFFQSQANFLLLRVPNPREIIEGLKGRGILVRPKNTPEGKEAVRISIGTLEDTNQLIKSLTEILS